MEYRIIITQNNKKKKVIYESNNLSTIKKKYFNIKDNNKVLYPKKNSTYKKVHPIHHEILLLKKWDKEDTPFMGRDQLGKNIEVVDNNKNWTILNKHPFEIEEKLLR